MQKRLSKTISAMNNFWKRTLSGIALIIIFFGAILLSEYAMLALILLIYSLSVVEFNRMMKIKNPQLLALSLVTGGLLVLCNYLILSGALSLNTCLLYIAGALTVFVLYYLLSNKVAVSKIATMFLANFWIALSLSFYMALGWVDQPDNYSPEIILIVLGFIWTNDIAAYVIGSVIGKRALAPSISPAKTLEGFIGGIVLNALAGYLAFIITDKQSIAFWIMVSTIVSLGATAGDLFESKLKREAGVKDSGNLIPGHGGMLDRFDSLFVSAPLVYMIYLIIVKL